MEHREGSTGTPGSPQAKQGTRGSEQARSRERDRRHGRDADSPGGIPLRGWKDTLVRVKTQIAADHMTIIAAGVAFYAMLAIFPALIALVSVYGLVFSPAEVEAQIQALSAVLPNEARTVIGGQLEALVQRPRTTLGWGAVLGIVGALWTASSGTANMMEAINIAYDERDRGFVKARALAVVFTFGLIVAVVVALALVALAPALLGFIGLGVVGRVAVQWGRWPVLALLVIGGLALLYRYAPNRKRAKLRWVTWGSGIATLLWIAASIGFSLYVENFGSYAKSYGALAGVIVLMFWLFISAFVILLGAELNAELEAQTARDSTVGADEPRGRRGARKADVLGEVH